MSDEQREKKRFLIFALTRISGLIVVALGLTLGLSDWLGTRAPLAGAALILIGSVEMAFVPLLLRKAWERR